ncbi:monocarboxylate transporter 12-like isoform X2 [Glandiceps talaboti]
METAWVGSIVLMVTVSTNPFAAYLAERYGHRRIAMVGGVIASAALMASAFTTSLTQLYLTYGVLLGIGYSFAHLPSYVMVGRYFRKRLSIAMGIALAGTGIGQFAMAWIMQTLKEKYGWRGTFMILSGLTLNLCVAAALLRPLKPVLKKKKKRKSKKGSDDYVKDDSVFNDDIWVQPNEESDKYNGINSENYFKNTKNTFRLEKNDLGKSNSIKHSSHNFISNYLPFTRGHEIWVHRDSESSIASSEPDEEQEAIAQSTLLAMAELSYGGSGFLWMPPDRDESSESESDSENGQKPDNTKLHYIELPEDALVEKSRLYKIKACLKKVKNGIIKCGKMVNKVMDFSLWKDPCFVVIQVCFLFHYSGHAIVTSHMVKRARDYGLPDSEGSSLVAFMGITQSIGRVLFGGLGNVNGVKPLFVYSASTFICGVCAIASVFLYSYAGQMVTSTIFGLFMGSYITMIPVICAKYFGPEKFRTTSAFTFQLQGLGHIIGSPLGGWMRDITGIYDSAFYLSGVWLFLATFLMLFVPRLSKRGQRKEEEKKAQQEDVPTILVENEEDKLDDPRFDEMLQLMITTV